MTSEQNASQAELTKAERGTLRDAVNLSNSSELLGNVTRVVERILAARQADAKAVAVDELVTCPECRSTFEHEYLTTAQRPEAAAVLRLHQYAGAMEDGEPLRCLCGVLPPCDSDGEDRVVLDEVAHEWMAAHQARELADSAAQRPDGVTVTEAAVVRRIVDDLRRLGPEWDRVLVERVAEHIERRAAEVSGGTEGAAGS